MRLTRVLMLAGIVVAGAYLDSRAASAQPLPTVDRVDLDRYLGRWYEIARYPNRFQRECSGEVTATYSRRDDGRIEVDNRCTRADGSVDRAVGVARIADPATNAKLAVRFAPELLAWLPLVWGDYWIVDLAPDYTHAVIGEPSRRYLWILARTPTLPKGTLNAILARLPGIGYDPSKLIGKELPE